ncbi:MAG: hypothetical protein IKV61_01880 [Clostridia bacterium]|nr:hypothetical protein [Clostridia bacterium]
MIIEDIYDMQILALLIIGIVAIVAFVIFLIRLWIGIETRCPHCKKKFALKEIDRKLIDKKRISKMERHNIYNKKGKVTGSRDVRVYGTRLTYELECVCKYCCKKTFKMQDVDKY